MRLIAGLPRIHTYKELDRHRQMLDQGKESVMREVIDGQMRVLVMSSTGSIIAILDPKFTSQFDVYFTAYGNGDGLLPGFDQTMRSTR